LDIGQSAPLQAPSGAPRRVAGISGACLYVPASTYRTVTEASGEFFDEDFFAYREDAELAFRAQLLGIHSYLVPSARGRHCRQLRGTQRQVSVEIDRLGVRNRFLFASKYGLGRPGLAPLVLARDAVVILGVLLRERTSLPGLRDAWQLRHAMRAKGRRVGTAAAHRK
jgi:GT2 family glycosyltransferase